MTVSTTPDRTGVRQAAAMVAHIKRHSPRETFSPARWPYTYAYDFIRQYWQDFEQWRNGDSGMPSRSQASDVLLRFARSAGQTPHEVLEVFALAYLDQYGIESTASQRAAIWTPEPPSGASA